MRHLSIFIGLYIICTANVAAESMKTVCNIAWEHCKQVPISPHDLVMPTSAILAAKMVGEPAAPSSPAPDKAAKAAEILASLAVDPFNKAKQGEARKIIADCDASKDINEMFSCTGFLVTPQVRLQCLRTDTCLPVEFSPLTMEASKQWRDWFTTYSDKGPDAAIVYARPWLASRDQVKACGKHSRDKAEFTLCLTNAMGGAEAAKARECYKKNANSPEQFGPCLTDSRLSVQEAKAVRCLTATPENRKSCIAGLTGEIAPKVISCLDMAKNDVSLFGKCVSGTRVAVDNVEVRKVTSCVDVAMEKIGPTNRDYAPLLNCAVQSGAGADLVHAFKANKKLVDCGTQNADKPLEAAECLKSAGVKLPREVQIAACIQKANTALEIAECGGAKLPAEVDLAKKCVESSQGDNGKIALCMAGNIGLSPEQKRFVTCAQKGTVGSAAACMAAPYGSKDFGLALQCVSETGGDVAGSAICMAGPRMNAELRIAAQCAASSGGVPVTFAACAGGQLALKELQQCISGNWQAESGCFGENNEVVKYYRNMENIARGVLRAAGLESAYDNMLNDIHSGKLGKNNEISRIFNLLNAVAIKTPEEAARQIADEASKAGQRLGEGVNKLAEEAEKARVQVQQVVQQYAPQVPSISLNNGQVTAQVGPASVTVDNRHAEANVGPVHISFGW